MHNKFVLGSVLCDLHTTKNYIFCDIFEISSSRQDFWTSFFVYFMCTKNIWIKEKNPGYPGISRFYMNKIPGLKILGSWAFNYTVIKKSHDWDFHKIPGVKDWTNPRILASLHYVGPLYYWLTERGRRKFWEPKFWGSLVGLANKGPSKWKVLGF